MAAGLRERKKQKTREEIFEAARELFGKRGFESVTVAEVARAADVSQVTVFNYFPTKEDLFYSRLEAFEEELLASVRDRQPGESVIRAFGRFLTTPRGLPDVDRKISQSTRYVPGISEAAQRGAKLVPGMPARIRKV